MPNLHRLLAVSLLACSAQASALNLGDLLNKEQLGNIGKAAPPVSAPAAASPAPAAKSQTSDLSMFSNKDQVASLKQALTQGAETAVRNLAKENGYLGNDKVRIPLPESLQKADNLLRKFGMGSYADDLVTSMNRAAEAAVPEAKTLLIGAVKQMTVADAKAILTGGDDAATQYFRKTTETALTGKFKPIVAKSMQKVKLAQTYDRFAGKGAQVGLVEERDAKLDDYITRKALDGLFLMMAEQEKAIRANPLEATGNLAKKVFSVLRGQ
ncbi:hypothetical protein FGKAn22_20140 [Ferrigenium kumadai]|uniref:DUF4197 domain-containing protein n=1 Tax=Ferrigenium kumadai TaxID=1682490 RepID=A0AAN1T139_9PROT|nr:DUF4197 domain-containing protein [Ferrigenium kumadai]BBJ00322.1 hypothetical protein FGKAn22_20140 [Ferrigenium kumadai]